MFCLSSSFDQLHAALPLPQTRPQFARGKPDGDQPELPAAYLLGLQASFGRMLIEFPDANRLVANGSRGAR